MNPQELIYFYQRNLDFWGEKPSKIVDIYSQFQQFLNAVDNPWDRKTLPGHLTGSGLVINRECTHVALTHHGRLNKWMQFGGHCDQDRDLSIVATREVAEESGLVNLQMVKHDGQPLPIDIDRHPIPARPGEKAHDHFDVMFLMIAEGCPPLQLSDESHDVAWKPVSILSELGPRLQRAAQHLLFFATHRATASNSELTTAQGDLHSLGN